MSGYKPTETRLRDRVKGSLGEYAHEFGIDGEAAMDEWIDQALADRDNRVRANERAKIEEERRREHAEASAQRVPPIVEMADGFVGGTKIDRLGIELMRVWGRVDKTSSVSQHPLGYVATFADMARAVLDWPELADERAKRPDREQIDRIQFEIDNVHQIHGDTCLCGFKSSRSRSRTEHLTALFAEAVLALEPETDQELQDRIEVLEKNLAYEVAQKIKLAEQLQAATVTGPTLEQARWKLHAGIESRCSEEVAAEAKPVIDLVFSSLALEPEASEDKLEHLAAVTNINLITKAMLEEVGYPSHFHPADAPSWAYSVLEEEHEARTAPEAHEVTDAAVVRALVAYGYSENDLRFDPGVRMRAALEAAREVE